MILLTADNGAQGREPWLTDGTAAGTHLVKDIYPGLNSSTTYEEPRFWAVKDWLVTSAGQFLFQANDGIHGREVWASDGTEAGTILLQDANPGENSGDLSELTELEGIVYFSIGSAPHAYLWRTDGTPAGTSLIKEFLGSQGAGSSLRDITASSGRLFFSASTETADRELWTSEDDLVFPGVLGGYLDASALARRYRAALVRAQLRPLRFHDLRHTFGTRMIAKADIRRVQEWMGHADVATTMKYLHYVERPDEARLVAEAFELQEHENRLGGRSYPSIGRSPETL
jgi:ELWxxDGT repeat protein